MPFSNTITFWFEPCGMSFICLHTFLIMSKNSIKERQSQSKRFVNRCDRMSHLAIVNTFAVDNPLSTYRIAECFGNWIRFLFHLSPYELEVRLGVQPSSQGFAVLRLSVRPTDHEVYLTIWIKVMPFLHFVRLAVIIIFLLC